MRRLVNELATNYQDEPVYQMLVRVYDEHFIEVESELPITSFIKNEQTETLPPYLEEVTQKVLRSFDLFENLKVLLPQVRGKTYGKRNLR